MQEADNGIVVLYDFSCVRLLGDQPCLRSERKQSAGQGYVAERNAHNGSGY
jgi:hypothetical protein